MSPEERCEFWACFWPYDFRTDAQRKQEEDAGPEPIRKVTPREREHYERFRAQVIRFIEGYGEDDYPPWAVERFFDDVVELLRVCASLHGQDVLAPSKANRERLAVLRKLSTLSETLKAHIHDKQWELYDQHLYRKNTEKHSFTPGVTAKLEVQVVHRPDPAIVQLMTILNEPIDDSHAIDIKKYFLREAVRLCLKWNILIEIEESYGFYRLIGLLKPELNISLDHRKRWEEIQYFAKSL